MILVEITAILLFTTALIWARRRNPSRVAELMSGLVYGLILEALDMAVFRTYHYGIGYALMAGPVPISIALLWSLILASSMALSDRLNLSLWKRPFADALFAVLIDLSIDAIAIRLGYWHWKIRPDQGWFGVPAGNLYGWMWVTFWFSMITRWVRGARLQKKSSAWMQMFVPLPAYLGLFVCLLVMGRLATAWSLSDPNQRLILFWILAAGFFCVAFIPFKGLTLTGPPIPSIFGMSRLLIHLYFVGALFVTGWGFRMPVLLAVALSVFAVEGFLVLRTR